MQKLLVVLGILAGFFVSSAWAGGQKEIPPTLRSDFASPVFLAPANPDASSRNLVLPFAPQAAKGQSLKAWSFTVYDATGKIVWSKSDAQTKDRGFFGELLNLGPRMAVEIPSQVIWDGTYQLAESPDNGKPVPSGNYTYILSVTDSAGSVTRTQPFTVSIENSPVRVDRLAVDNTIFSPLGKRSTLTIQQTGSREMRWEGTFSDPKGNLVRTYLWSNDNGLPSLDPSPPDFAWDGKDNSGNVLPDGDYQYSLRGTNRAGATLVKALDQILVINEGQAALRLSSDRNLFSPKADTSWPTSLTFRTDAGNSDGLIDWTVTITDPTNPKVPFWTKTGKAPLPSSVVFDGHDVLGRAIPDGHYQAVLWASFSNGNTGTAPPFSFDLQTAAPAGTLTSEASVFGGSGRPSVMAKFLGQSGLTWKLDVISPEGKVLKTLDLGSSGKATRDVLGADMATIAAPDGKYLLRAGTHDAAGNLGVAELTLIKDSRKRSGAIDLSRTVLVPGKGSDGQLRVTPVLNLLDTISSGELEILSSQGEVIAQKPFDGIPSFWDWQGTTTSGLPADGEYSVVLTALYNNGEIVKTSVPLKVDSQYLTAPQGTMTVSSPVFGGSLRPSVKATFAGDAGFHWMLDVLGAKNQRLRQYDLGTTGQAVVEVGTDTSGKPLPDGDYTLKASAKNSAGLLGSATADVKKDSRAMKVSLDLAPPILVPGSPLNGTLKVTPVLEVLDSIISTNLSVNQGSTKILEKSWTGLVPFWNWDGTDSLGKTLPNGVYQVGISVTYANGTESGAQKDFKLDSTFLKEPQGTLSSTDTVFGGSGRTGVTISFQGDSGIPWTLDILDKDGKSIHRQSLGNSGQSKWDFQGLDERGQPLPDGPYTVKASATSQAGIAGTALLQLRKDSRQGQATIDLSRSVLVPGRGTSGIVRITPLLDVVDSIDKTVLSILGPDGKTVNEKSSDGTISFWDWNGTDSQQKTLSNGVYQIALSINYSNGSVTRATGSVKIDSTYLNDQGPLVDMTFSSKTFAPNNADGPSDLTVFIKTTEGVVPVASWQLAVIDPRGKNFRQWSGKGIPPASVYWDGKADSGDLVESGEDYQVLLKVADIQGHVTRKQDTVTIDISVVKIGEGKYKIVVSSIHFAGYSSDIFQVQGDLLDKNLFVLRRLANALGKFPGYKIKLEGYAVSEYWNDPKTAEWEQKNQLLPLSLNRAQAVRNVMVLLGIDAGRFNVQGFGANSPVVPNSDLENRWKNRRVEFYLEK